MFTYREARDATNKLNEEERWAKFCGVMLLLQEAGVEEIRLSYSGSGDSGDYSEMIAFPGRAWSKVLEHPDIEVKDIYFSLPDGLQVQRSDMVTSAGWILRYSTETVSVESLVEDYLHRCVSLFFGGYENNEGGQGTATLDVKEWEICVEHSNNEMSDFLAQEINVDMQNEATAEFTTGVKACMYCWNQTSDEDDKITKITASAGSETAEGGYYWGFNLVRASGRSNFIWGEEDKDKITSLAILCDTWMRKVGKDISDFEDDSGQEIRIVIDIDTNDIDVSLWEQEGVQMERETRVFSIRENAPVRSDQEAS